MIFFYNPMITHNGIHYQQIAKNFVAYLRQSDGRGNTRPNQETATTIGITDLQTSGLTCKIDYFRLKAKIDCTTGVLQDKVKAFLDLAFMVGNDNTQNYEILPQTYWSPGSGCPGYDNKIIGLHGCVGGYKKIEDNNECKDAIAYEFMIDFPGTFFADKDKVTVWRWCNGLSNVYSIKCCRFDIAIDDHNIAYIPLSDMIKAYYDGNNCHFKNLKPIIESKQTKDGIIESQSWYFGSRNSGKMVRIYHHKDSHINSLRYECELKKGYAKVLFNEFINLKRDNMCNDEFNQFIAVWLGSKAVGAIDFVNKSEQAIDTNRKNKSINKGDCQRLEFWQKFIDLVGVWLKPIGIYKASTTIEANMKWIKRQVATSLAAVKLALGISKACTWLREIMDNNVHRCNNKTMHINSIKTAPNVIKLAI